VPAAPLAGVTAVSVGAVAVPPPVYVNWVATVTAPLWVPSTTLTVPLPAGAMAKHTVVLEQLVLALFPPNVTAVDPGTKFAPVNWTVVPIGPLVGAMVLTTGAVCASAR
jgi:hypothetical protein